MRKILFTAALGFISFSAFSQYACSDFKRSATPPVGTPNLDYSALSDTFDIVHTHLDFDLTALPTNQWSAVATLNVVKKQAAQRFSFQLDGFVIDSASVNGTAVSVLQPSAYPFNMLNNLPTWNVQDTATVVIHYSGSAVADPSGWGGWHHNSPYFFNLGVGFGVNPHSYGRSLFPAFDNFVEHSTYSFHITTSNGRLAYANGLRTSLNTDPNTLITTQDWDCTDPMPAYLVSVAVSNYAELNDTLALANGQFIPSMLMARPGDTANVAQSFRHLQGILTGFEKYFGNYIWDKVGYAMTTQGAMEHATSIHLPISLANGSLSGESIIAHELAHHWWGNLITCATAEDMWINEGMAEFSSHLYLEEVYNRARYMDEVRGNQLSVLNYAHVRDGGYMPLNGVDHSTTYGMHVYNKGAWVGHNLRGYLGDSLYTATIHALFQNHAHQNATTAQFQQWLEQESGVSLSDFFQDWVLQAGQAAVSVGKVNVTNNGTSWDATVTFYQHKKERSQYLHDAPMELRLYGGNNTYTQQVRVSGDSTVVQVSGLNFAPTYATINEGEAYLAGTTFSRAKLTDNATYNLDPAKARLTIVSTPTDSADFYLAHHWAGPSTKSPLARISSSRFWSLKGDLAGVEGELRMNFDGRPNTGSLDADLVGVTEDSIVVMFRADASHDWDFFPFYEVENLGSTTNAFGYITLTKLVPGDYVFANAGNLSTEEHGYNSGMKVFPNPNKGELTIEQFATESDSIILDIFSTSGELVHSQKWRVEAGWNNLNLHLELPNGTYIIKTKMGEQQVLIAH